VLRKGIKQVSTAIARIAVFFKDSDDSEPVRDWLMQLKKKNQIVHGKITTRINRAAAGNFGNYRMLGGGFGELKIDFGPGYRIYFGLVGDRLVVLLNGGSKGNQQADIELAKSRWERYLREDREREEFQ
jgi:putative addiction module killer protein